MSHKRLKRICVFVLIILAVGIAYGAFVKVTGKGVPCLFYMLTGFQCPGCGITHMCIALLGLDFAAAFESHPMLLVQSPFLLLILLRNTIQYVKIGRWQLSRLESGVIYICIALLVVFSIVRNATRL